MRLAGLARLSLLHSFITVLGLLLLAPASGAEPGSDLGFEQLSALRSARTVDISPGGEWVAYALSVPRQPGEDDDGPAWMELHLVPVDGGEDRGYVTGSVNVSVVRFTPDGKLVTYIARRQGDDHRSLWAIPVHGGESRKLLEHDTDLLNYVISPDSSRVAFIATEKESDRRKEAREKGYKQQVFEEDWLARKVWVAPMPPFIRPNTAPFGTDESETDPPRALTVEGSVFDLDWSPDGTRLALAVAPRPLVDDSYMFKRVGIYDASSGEKLAAVENRGKLGRIAYSPDGKHVAMIAAADENDPMEGRLMVAPVTGGAPRDLMPDLQGHITDFDWKDGETLLWLADIGVKTGFGLVGLDGEEAQAPVDDGKRGPIMYSVRISEDGARMALLAETPTHEREVYSSTDESPGFRRLTNSNPWLNDVTLADQRVVRWKARDGLELEGILIEPLQDGLGDPPPLIIIAHGGPEGHFRNGWNSSYSRPGQLAAAQGFAVFFPNYRGSTGRGVAFSKLGQSDAAGPEFDDLIDGLDYLVSEGIVDGDRVGVAGGSYGGYATAWLGTRYTERFRAGVMFVGISNKLSKALTTDIPYEDLLVHTRYDPWTRFEFSVERSPLSHVEQSRTALLIAGGTTDPRVHPSQSLQFYRALKMIGKTPVRYVRYPDEGHGNRRAAARNDYTHRLVRWMRHFVADGATELPPWDLELGMDLEDEEEGGDE